MQFDDKTKMIKTEKDGYFHEGECYQKHLEHRTFIEKENEEWDELYRYVKQLHGYPDGIPLPTMPVARLKALREGYDIIGGKREKKKWKQGATFSLMLAAYKLKEKDIKWFIHNVLNDQCDAASISKCITLMLKGLGEAWRLEQKKKEKEVEKEKVLSEVKKEELIFKEIKYKKKTDDMDISDLL